MSESTEFALQLVRARDNKDILHYVILKYIALPLHLNMHTECILVIDIGKSRFQFAQ